MRRATPIATGGRGRLPRDAAGPELVILAVQRLGRDRGRGPTTLAEGDTLLVHGSWSAVESLSDHGEVLVVNSPDLVRRQAVPLGAKAVPAIAVLLGMVVLWPWASSLRRSPACWPPRPWCCCASWAASRPTARSPGPPWS